jgi:hypothetical protein
MSSGQKTFGSKSSLAMIDKILDFITENEMVTAAQVQEITGLSEHYNGSYLRHMGQKGLIHVAYRQVSRQGGSTPNHWAVGSADGMPIDSGDSFPRLVARPKQWPTNQVRDPYHLPTEFFSRTTA